MGERSSVRGEIWKRGYLSGVKSAMKGGLGEVDEEGGSEIWRVEISGEAGSCLIIGIGGSGSKSLRGWRKVQIFKTSLLGTAHAGGFCIVGSVIIFGSGLLIFGVF